MTLKQKLAALVAAASFALAGLPAAAQDHDTAEPPAQKWSFAGPLGKFDRAQLQRGFKVYREVCGNCHSMSLLSFRSLAEPGGPEFSAAQAQAVAGEYKVKDGPNDQGEMFDRPGRVADHFPPPFPNDAAARASNGGALPPDLSVIAKARTYERGFPRFLLDVVTQYQEQGVDYIVALLKGYEKVPQGMQMAPGMTYNKFFPGHGIAMPAPIADGQVSYDDGSPATIDQYAKDVAAFLAWTAEPHMEARKRLGLQVIIILLVLSGMLYFTKKRIWHAVQLRPDTLSRKS
jgi:ubiquinol-cytochrome c reductase cytochrome b/c1 subunit